MPNVDSYKVVVPEFEGLINAAEENAALLPDVKAEQTELRETITEIKTLKLRQESLRAQRQQATQDLKKAIAKGQDLAGRIRDAAKFKIGRREERLVQFRITPQGRPAKRKQEKPAPETANPAAAEPAKA